MNRQFRKYLGYAVGEIVLVIAGILIALRIDTWHEERQTQRAIDEYLTGIARNIREDINEIEVLRAKREAAMFASKVVRWNMGWLTSYNVAEIDFAGDALVLAREQHYFNANTSSYEGFRSSGLLSSLGSQQIESLLFEYYEIVSRIRQFEQNHNDYLRGLSLQFTSHTYGNLMLALREPTFFTDEEFADSELQAGYRKVLTDPVVQAWYEATGLQPLLIDYRKLESLGKLYIDLVEQGGSNADGALQAVFHDPNSELEYEKVLVDGELAWHSYSVNWYPTPDNEIPEKRGTYSSKFDAVSFADGSMDVTYPGLAHIGGPAWAAVIISVGGPSPSAVRETKDYSEFTRLRLEMKGANGGERFSIHLKDSDDPDDGSQTDIPVVLTNDWQNYDFELADFENADPSKLFAVTGFLFYQQPEPVSFAIRNITYLKPE